MDVTHITGYTLGDFLNTMPFLSWYSKSKNEKIDLILPKKMAIFKGLDEFLLHQDFIGSVRFKTAKNANFNLRPTHGSVDRFPGMSWQTANNLGFDDIDMDLVLKIPFKEAEKQDKVYCCDRWSNRIMERSGLFRGIEFVFMDTTKDISYNLNIIKNSKMPVYTTFTGISILLNLCNIPIKIIYFDDLAGNSYYNKPTEYWYRSHFFINRGTEIIYYKDLI